MEVNMKKTKIMIFQKHNTKLQQLKFLFGNHPVSITNEYTYLGLKLTPNAKFSIANQHLSEKATNALCKIRKHLNIHDLSPKTSSKIFDAIISPILLYGSEVWGAYDKIDFSKWDKTPTEKTHLRFCKLYLGVNRKASNIASRAELGKFPLLITTYKRILNYVNHINELPETSIAKQAFLLSKELYTSGKESFYSKVVNILKLHDLTLCEPIEIETNLKNTKIEEIIKDIKEKYISYWKQELTNSRKLSFYQTFKKGYQLEKYLNVIKNFSQRRTYTRFRISNHKLEIEYGRYQNTPRDERICKNCNLQEVEDEFHFSLECQKYETLRNEHIIF